VCSFFFFQAEDGIRDLVRSRGLGDVYKRQKQIRPNTLLVTDQLSHNLCSKPKGLMILRSTGFIHELSK